MKTNLRKCDRCGTLFERNTTIPYYRFSRHQYVSKVKTRPWDKDETYRDFENIKNETFDLCEDCQKQFEEWLERGKNENKSI